MSKPQPTRIYRSILKEAFELTWKRKSLWVFGLFAGLISTGGVVDMALRSLQRVKNQGAFLEQLIDRSFIGYNLFASYLQQLYLLGSTRVSWIITACTLVVLGLIIAGILSQIALILSSASPTDLHPHHLRKRALEHFWSVFTIDLVTKVFSIILTGLTSLPFLFFFLNTSPYSFWIVFLQTLVFLPLIVVLNIISIIAIIDGVDRKTNPLEALSTAIHLFKRQWVATLEFGLILFLLVLLGGISLIVLSGILLIPYALVYTAALLTGSLSFFFIANTLFGLCFVILVFFFAGAIITFHYTAWHRFYKRAMHKQHGSKVFSKILRFFP